MLAGVSGIVVRVSGQLLLLKAGQLTFAGEMPLIQSAELRPGDEVELHTYLHFSSKTDQLRLFAFTTAAARDLFVTLLSGSGVGPRVALALLELDVPGLITAIVEGNEKALTSVPGVGSRLAKKIILELADKITRDHAAAGATAGSAQRSGNVEDALDAVAALGFTRLQAEQGLSRAKLADSGLATAEVIRHILAQLSRP